MKKIVKKAYLILLIALLAFPSFGYFFKVELMENCEYRDLAPLPEKWALSKECYQEFKLFYKDHFIFRNVFNHLNSSFKYTFFEASIKPQDVKTGKDNWLFYTSLGDREITSFAHKNLLSEDELASQTKIWEDRAQELKNRNIDYYQAVYPNKSTIYKEYIPYFMKQLQVDTFSKIDQVRAYLAKVNSPIKLIDPRKEILENKGKAQLYYKNDTHWNNLGAFYGYQKVMAGMNIKSYDENAFDIVWEEENNGDLKSIMGLCNCTSIKESSPLFTLKNKDFEIKRENTDIDGVFVEKNSSGKVSKKILVFRDSYTMAMTQFISLHFKESYYMWAGYNQEVVDKIKPDVVLVSSVERYF